MLTNYYTPWKQLHDMGGDGKLDRTLSRIRKDKYTAPNHLVYKITDRQYVYEGMAGWWQEDRDEGKSSYLPNMKGVGPFYVVNPPTMWGYAEEVSSAKLLRKYVELLDDGKVKDTKAMYHAIRLLTQK